MHERRIRIKGGPWYKTRCEIYSSFFLREEDLEVSDYAVWLLYIVLFLFGKEGDYVKPGRFDLGVS